MIKHLNMNKLIHIQMFYLWPLACDLNTEESFESIVHLQQRYVADLKRDIFKKLNHSVDKGLPWWHLEQLRYVPSVPTGTYLYIIILTKVHTKVTTKNGSKSCFEATFRDNDFIDSHCRSSVVDG